MTPYPVLTKKQRVTVISERGGMRGVVLVTLWLVSDNTNGGVPPTWACRPVEEAGWDGRPIFFNETELIATL